MKSFLKRVARPGKHLREEIAKAIARASRFLFPPAACVELEDRRMLTAPTISSVNPAFPWRPAVRRSFTINQQLPKWLHGNVADHPERDLPQPDDILVEFHTDCHQPQLRDHGGHLGRAGHQPRQRTFSSA